MFNVHFCAKSFLYFLALYGVPRACTHAKWNTWTAKREESVCVLLLTACVQYSNGSAWQAIMVRMASLVHQFVRACYPIMADGRTTKGAAENACVGWYMGLVDIVVA